MIQSIDPTSPVPISEQIAEGVRFEIAGGRLATGERLPSVRGLAKDLLVNPNTVAKVYRDLERDGILRAKPGSGVFVARGAADRCRRLSQAAVRGAIAAAVAKGLAAGLAGAEIEALLFDCLVEAKAVSHERS
jgi:GntR family transcriptional regulator